MAGLDNLIMTEKPELRHPHMVCGIGGWVDGGEASTGTVRYLIRKLGARRFAEIPLENFHVYQVPGQLSLRPTIRIENGVLKEHHLPHNRFHYYTNPDADNDLVLFLGAEPNVKWMEYADILLNMIEYFAVQRVYLLGGVLDKVPHTREPGVSCTCSSEKLKGEMQNYQMHFSSYEGPGRFGNTLLHLCQRKGIEMVSLTSRATYYPEFNIVIPHNPKSIWVLAKRLRSMLKLDLDLSGLEKQSGEFESKLNFMVSHNPEFKSYMEELEKDYSEIKYEEPLNISASEAIQIAEEFLKGKKEEGEEE